MDFMIMGFLGAVGVILGVMFFPYILTMLVCIMAVVLHVVFWIVSTVFYMVFVVVDMIRRIAK